MKRQLMASAVMLAAASASAQSIPDAVTEPVTITFYNYNLSSAGNGAEATKKMIAEFEAANPNIKVKGVPVNPQDLATRIQADIVAGQPVDLAQMPFAALGFATENLGAQALEDIIPAAEMSAHFEGMVPNGLELGRLDGKTYGLAYTFSTPVLFYNADLFRKAGLDPENPPKTWAEIKAAGLALKEKTDALPLSTGLFGPTALDWLMQGLIASNGGAVISPDRKTMTFAAPESVEAIEMLRDLAQNGVTRNMPAIAHLESMASGKSAMYLQTSAIQGFLVKGATDNFELRAAAMPAFGDKPAKPSNSGSALSLHSTDPLKQRATWDLMKFLTSKHGYTIITSEIGYLPLRPEIVDDPEYLGEWVKEHPLVQPNLEQLSRLYAYVPLPGPNYLQIGVSMMDAMELATFGDDDDVQGILAAAEAQTQNLMP
ncbi:MAG: ABC transporter substrate-binding protein [Pikeienuella sp.]